MTPENGHNDKNKHADDGYTRLERRGYRALDALKIRYWPQRNVGYFRPDAVLPGYAIGLEFDGDEVHGCPECHMEDLAPHDAARRKWRDNILLRKYGILVVRIWGHDMESDQQAVESVRRALAPYVQSVRETHERKVS